MFSFTLTLTVLAAASVITASPVASQACNSDTSTLGQFKLFAQEQGSNETQIIRLVSAGLDSNNNPISTMTVCETCGDAPAYWQLKDSILTPYLPNAAKGLSIINMPLEQGKINFVTGSESSLVKSSTYCAVENSLAVGGDTNSFSICSFIGTRDHTSRRDVYFKQTSTRVASNCQPAQLIMQSCS